MAKQLTIIWYQVVYILYMAPNHTLVVTCEADVWVEMIDDEINFLVLASYPLWKVMSINQR